MDDFDIASLQVDRAKESLDQVANDGLLGDAVGVKTLEAFNEAVARLNDAAEARRKSESQPSD